MKGTNEELGKQLLRESGLTDYPKGGAQAIFPGAAAHRAPAPAPAALEQAPREAAENRRF